MRKYTVINLKTGEVKEFIGGEEAKRKALALERKWWNNGVNYKSEEKRP